MTVSFSAARRLSGIFISCNNKPRGVDKKSGNGWKVVAGSGPVEQKTGKQKYLDGEKVGETVDGATYEYNKKKQIGGVSVDDKNYMTIKLKNGYTITYDASNYPSEPVKGTVYDDQNKKVGQTKAKMENGKILIDSTDIGKWNKQPPSIIKSPNFKKLDKAQQQQVLDIYIKTDNEGRKRLAGLLAKNNFKKLDKAQQQQVLDIYNKTNSEGQEHLCELLDRNIDGKSALLNTDKDGKTLLTNLHTIANQKLAPELAKEGITREKLLSTIMQETGKPGQINQSDHGTCSVTSMQYMLCDQNPAEYARLMSGLLSPEGKATMRNGDELIRDAKSIAPDSAKDRSASERIFQSAMMEYSNGGDNYDNTSDKNKSSFLWFSDEYSGLFPDQEERGLEALFGKNFDYYTKSWNFKDDKQDIVDKLTERSGTNTYVRMKWGAKKKDNHAVVVTRVENGRVYFRNPWGATPIDAKGKKDSDPPRVLENPATREESMTIEDFKKYVKGAMIPQN